MIDKNLNALETICIVIFKESDNNLFNYAERLVLNSSIKVTCLNMDTENDLSSKTLTEINKINTLSPGQISSMSFNEVDESFLSKFNLVILSLDGWRRILIHNNSLLQMLPSTLIISDKLKN